MKTNTTKGFTLIELIMVIVILGILAAVAVPKFFDMTGSAHHKNQQAVIGNIKSGLQLYAADKLISDGTKAYPDGDVLELDADLSDILDEFPEDWSVAAGANDDEAKIVYEGGSTDTTYTYTSDGSSYTISAGVGD